MGVLNIDVVLDTELIACAYNPVFVGFVEPAGCSSKRTSSMWRCVLIICALPHMERRNSNAQLCALSNIRELCLVG